MNRCGIIVSGWFEWTEDKQPYAFKRKSNDCVFIAGLITHENSVIILTKEAEKHISHVHHRMPLLLDEDSTLDLWLDPNLKFNDIISKILQNHTTYS